VSEWLTSEHRSYQVAMELTSRRHARRSFVVERRILRYEIRIRNGHVDQRLVSTLQASNISQRKTKEMGYAGRCPFILSEITFQPPLLVDTPFMSRSNLLHLTHQCRPSQSPSLKQSNCVRKSSQVIRIASSTRRIKHHHTLTPHRIQIIHKHVPTTLHVRNSALTVL
jgi:hypothetical protein